MNSASAPLVTIVDRRPRFALKKRLHLFQLILTNGFQFVSFFFQNASKAS